MYNKSFENDSECKYMRITHGLTNRSDAHDGIRRIINSGNTCCSSVEKLIIPSTFQNADD
jgi:hypothetical protein